MDNRRRSKLWELQFAPMALAVAATLTYAAWVALGQDPGLKSLMNLVYDGAFLMTALTCLATGVLHRNVRWAWIAFGVGLLSWDMGNAYLVHVLYELELPEIPYPSMADVGFLFALPCFFAGIAVLIRKRTGHFPISSWLDGMIAALATAALATAFLAPALVGLTMGEPATVFTNVAYPLGDLVLVAFISGAFVVTGLRNATPIILVGGGLLLWGFADSYYLYLEATTGYVAGWADLLWLLGALSIAAGGLFSASLRPRHAVIRRSALLPPAVSLVVAASILVIDRFVSVLGVSIWLAGATVLIAVLRLGISFRENDHLMRALHGEAVTDSLTGLGNRRLLLADIDEALEQSAHSERKLVFALFDLDGFKAYNDSFGHPAGDALLERLGQNLARGLDGDGGAYRLGGDEFCILVEIGARDPESIVEAARATLFEAGEGFMIGASGGWILLPEEAGTCSTALHLADQRMYAEKSRSSTRAARQTEDLLMRILHERDHTLTDHVDRVCRKALELGHEISLEPEALDLLGRAAQLHDIGKIAIPEDILNKPGPLDELEWKLIKRHTLIGERILGATPELKGIGHLVRSSHERWDGGGYPDGLAGKEIPLGARVIFIADAFDAMTTDRSYKRGMEKPEAIAELRRAAGTQFDPELVQAFCGLLERDDAHTGVDHLPNKGRDRSRGGVAAIGTGHGNRITTTRSDSQPHGSTPQKTSGPYRR